MKVAASEIPDGGGARSERAQPADGAAFKAALASEDVKLRKGETLEPVDGHAYSEIVSGRREGMYVNTSGNARHGETFVLVRKDGVNHHIYGSGADRQVVAVKPDAPAAADKPAAEDVKLRKGEQLEDVDGHAYAEIVAGRREGMYLNTSGNERHAQAFVLARKHGIEYHIYGSGADRLVVALRPGRRD